MPNDSTPTGLYGLIKGQFDTCAAYAEEAFARVKDYLDSLKLIIDSPLPLTDIVDYNWVEPHIDNPPWLNPPDRPVIPALDMPVLTFNFSEIPYDSEVLNNVIDVINDGLVNGGTGLSVIVETALWNQARSRTALDVERLRERLERDIASRGWTLPPGSLQAAISEAIIEETRANADINEKITIEQARLAQTNTHFMIQSAMTLEGQSREYWTAVMNRALESARALISGITEIFKAQVMYVSSQLDIYKSDVVAYEAQIKAAEVELGAQVEVYKAKVQQAKNETDLIIKAAEVNLTGFIHNRGLFLEIAKGGANVYAQLAASALNAIHAGANLGFSGNIGYSHDETKSVPGGMITETVYQHTYNETPSS